MELGMVKKQGMPKGLRGLISAAIVIVILLTAVAMTSAKVDPGYAGLVYSADGGLQSNTLSQGWHIFIAPWKSVREYPISTETVWLSKNGSEGNKTDESYNTSTMEGKPVSVDAYYTYHIAVDKLPMVFNKFKGVDVKTIEEGYLRQQIKAASQSVTSSYSVMDLYGNKRNEIQLAIQKKLSDELTPFGIDIETFSFGEVRPDPDTMKAIQEKVNAQQKLQQMQIELEQAKITAQKATVDAQGTADAAVIAAKGTADANAKIQASLTPELVQYTIAKAWDGHLPQVSGSGGTMISLPLPDNTKK